MLQYQYEGNRPLAYALISYRDRFMRLLDVVQNSGLTVEEYRGDKIESRPFHTQVRCLKERPILISLLIVIFFF